MLMVTLCLGYMPSVTSHWVWMATSHFILSIELTDVEGHFTLRVHVKRHFTLWLSGHKSVCPSIRPPYVDGTLRLESVNADGHFLMKTGHFMSHYAECRYVDGHFMLGSSKRWWSLLDENWWSLYVTLCWVQMLMVTLCWEVVNADGHFLMKTDGHFVSHYAVRIIRRCWSLFAWRESAGKLLVTKLWGWRL